ncbi:MAG: alpha/beta fold hydrolase [Dehalococcoidia bacterium]
MPAVHVNGVEIFYQEAGQGFPLILSHEFAGSWESWREQVRYFSRRYRVIVYNDRGYPPSSVPPEAESYSEEHSVEDLRQLLDALAIEQAHIGGLSMGGSITLKFGIAHPERCRSLIIAGAGSGTTHTDQFRKDTAATATVFAEQGTASVAEFYTRGPARLQLLQKDPVGWQEFYDLFLQHSAVGSAHTLRQVQSKRKTIYEVEEQMRAVRVPALIMVGDEDELCLEPGLFMKRTLPNAGLAVLPKSGHGINLEEPLLFNQLVLDFLTRVEQGAWHPRRAVSTSMLPSVLPERKD